MSTTRRVFTEETTGTSHNSSGGNNYLFAIAIDNYVACPQLSNAVKDVEDLIELLRQDYNFEDENILRLYNEEATEDNILFQFRDLIRSITPSDNLLVYFSGHGRYDATMDEGYWIPVDARAEAESQQISNGKIMKILSRINSHHTFLIVDSCFAGSLFTQYRNVGTERLEQTASRWGLTAGRNEIVEDGNRGDNSPFAKSLLHHLRNNSASLSVSQLCNLVVEDVASNNDQIPRGEPLSGVGHRGGQYFFRRKEGATPSTATAGPAVVEPQKKTRGRVMHSLPERMELGRNTRCEIRISFDEETLKTDFPSVEPGAKLRKVNLSEFMHVKLIDASFGNHAFQIKEITSEKQFVDYHHYTHWIFTVKPLEIGTHELVVKISAQERRSGKWVPREIVLTESVTVVEDLAVEEEIQQSGSYKIAPYSIKLEAGAPEVKPVAATATPAPVAKPAPLVQKTVSKTITPPSVTPPKSNAGSSLGKRIGMGVGAMLVLAVVAFFLLDLIIQDERYATTDDYDAEEVEQPMEPDTPTEPERQIEQMYLLLENIAANTDSNPKAAELSVQKLEYAINNYSGTDPDDLTDVMKVYDDMVSNLYRRNRESTAPTLPHPPEERADIFIDPRDQKSYPTYEIAGTTWMMRDIYSTAVSGDLAAGGNNGERRYAADRFDFVCPTGWRFPTVVEFEELINSFGSDPYLSLVSTLHFQTLSTMQDEEGEYRFDDYPTSSEIDGQRYFFRLEHQSQSFDFVQGSPLNTFNCRCVR